MERDWETRHREESRPVEEAGGGEAEGFEQAEDRLIEEAENFDGGRSPLRDEIEQAEPYETDVFGEADEERSNADEDDW